MLPLKVNFVLKIYQAFTFYDNIKRLNMFFLIGEQMSILTVSSTKYMIRSIHRSFLHVTFVKESQFEKSRHETIKYAKKDRNRTRVDKLNTNFSATLSVERKRI